MLTWIRRPRAFSPSTPGQGSQRQCGASTHGSDSTCTPLVQLAGVLAQRGVPQADPVALIDVVAAIGAAEAGLVAQGHEQDLALLQWLLQLTAGDTGPAAGGTSAGPSGGGAAGGAGDARDLRAASLACEAWPKFAKVAKARRGPTLQDGGLFASAMQVPPACRAPAWRSPLVTCSWCALSGGFARTEMSPDTETCCASSV